MTTNAAASASYRGHPRERFDGYATWPLTCRCTYDPDAGLRDVPLVDMAATTIEPSPNTGGERPAAKANAEPAPPARTRVYWRAVVRTGGQVSASRERDRVE